MANEGTTDLVENYRLTKYQIEAKASRAEAEEVKTALGRPVVVVLWCGEVGWKTEKMKLFRSRPPTPTNKQTPLRGYHYKASAMRSHERFLFTQSSNCLFCLIILVFRSATHDNPSSQQSPPPFYLAVSTSHHPPLSPIDRGPLAHRHLNHVS